MKFRTMWCNGEEMCCFGVTDLETFRDAELVLTAYHKMADFLGMDKNNFTIEVLDGHFWNEIPPEEYYKYVVEV